MEPISIESSFLNSTVHDSKTNFTMNYYGFAGLSALTSNTMKRYKYAVSKALSDFKEIEMGKTINTTAILEESENRAVDHYNLRSSQEQIQGKSLQHSLSHWQEIKEKASDIIMGKTTNEKGEKFTDVIFNGIGGSYLGPLFLLVALKGPDFNVSSNLSIRLHFLSNTDPDSFYLLVTDKIQQHHRLSTTLMVNMSKSGSTAETKGNMDSFNEILLANGILNIGSQNIAITTPNSAFDQYAKKNNFLHVFYMNNETGGRFSVCSAIGMVPCAFAGLNFDEFLKGQGHMDELCRHEDVSLNPAMLIAIGMDHLNKNVGKKNMIVLGYSDFLKEFSHYLQQLYMESLGKEYSRDGIYKPEGQTLFGGVGTGEQHAFMQQVQKGMKDCFVKIVSFQKRKHDFANGKAGSMGRQLLAFVKGTEEALLRNGVPFFSLSYENCDMFNMGMMIALEENIVSILASFNNINAYDQPGVQDGKLAADKVIQVSKEIEAALMKQRLQWQHSQIDSQVVSENCWEGDVVDFKKELQLNQDTPLSFVDAILSDICANPQSYDPALQRNINIQRRWVNGRFLYKIIHLSKL